MLIKLIGLSAIIAASTGIGVLYASRLRLRVRQLESLYKMIQEIETLVRFQAMDSTEILRQLAGSGRYAVLTFLPSASRYSDSGEGLSDAFQKSVEENKDKLAFRREDSQILASFAAGFGTTDVEGQIKNCGLHKMLLEENLKSAKEDARQKSKMYCMLGISGGLALAILFI